MWRKLGTFYCQSRGGTNPRGGKILESHAASRVAGGKEIPGYRQRQRSLFSGGNAPGCEHGALLRLRYSKRKLHPRAEAPLLSAGNELGDRAVQRAGSGILADFGNIRRCVFLGRSSPYRGSAASLTKCSLAPRNRRHPVYIDLQRPGTHEPNLEVDQTCL